MKNNIEFVISTRSETIDTFLEKGHDIVNNVVSFFFFKLTAFCCNG